MAEANPTIDWSNFSDIKSPSGRYDWVNGLQVWGDYNHRLLPTEEDPLIREDQYHEYYTPFDTFNHVTSWKTAQKILEEDNLVHNKVGDNSIVNSKKYSHPLRQNKVMWFGPGCQNDTSPVERYGNVKFGMKSIEDEGGMINEVVKYYFVEVIDYFFQSACRILVTPHEYPALRVYDPYQKGGPWYIDEKGNHFHLTKILKDGEYRKNTLEIMREEYSTQDLIKNLTVSYVECYNPRKGVEVHDRRIEEPLRKLVEDSEFTWKENSKLSGESESESESD